MDADQEKLKALFTSDPSLDQADVQELFARVYELLHQRAVLLMQKERSDHTLQPTALLHEAFLRLSESGRAFNDQNHFIATASIVLRHILVNHARSKKAQKRSSNRVLIGLDTLSDQFQQSSIDLLDLDCALEELAELDSVQHRLVELRFFGGMTHNEAAATLGISERTAYQEWAHARAWLKCRIGAQS